MHAAKSGGLHANIRNRFSGLIPPVDQLNVRAHAVHHFQQTGSRGIDADTGDRDIRAGHNRRPDDEKSGRRQIARHGQFRRSGPSDGGSPFHHQRRALPFEREPVKLKEPFCMVAREPWLGQPGRAFGKQGCQEQRGLDLGAGHRR